MFKTVFVKCHSFSRSVVGVCVCGGDQSSLVALRILQIQIIMLKITNAQIRSVVYFVLQSHVFMAVGRLQ